MKYLYPSKDAIEPNTPVRLSNERFLALDLIVLEVNQVK
jgi:hypothetical protein